MTSTGSHGDNTFYNVGLKILCPDDNFHITLSPSGNETADRKLGIPLLGADDSLVTVGTNLIKLATITLSAAQIIAMNGAPVTLVPAPGAGKSIILRHLVLRSTRTSTAFTGGGASVVQYHTGAVAATNTIAAATFTGAAGVQDVLRVAIDVSPVQNDALEITNATAPFAAGTGTAQVFCYYQIV